LATTPATDLPVGGISIAEPNTPIESVDVALVVNHGTLTFNKDDDGAVSVYNNGTDNITLVGPLNDINDLLSDQANLIYVGNSGWHGFDYLQIGANETTDTSIFAVQRFVANREKERLPSCVPLRWALEPCWCVTGPPL
jgi:hypothetical protein